MKKSEIPSTLLLAKIKIHLSNVGLSEKYNAFDYLSDIIFYMLKHDDDSLQIYNQAITMISNKYSLNERTVKSSIQNLLKNCDGKIRYKTQFNLSSHSTLNKIRVLKNYIFDNLN